MVNYDLQACKKKIETTILTCRLVKRSDNNNNNTDLQTCKKNSDNNNTDLQAFKKKSDNNTDLQARKKNSDNNNNTDLQSCKTNCQLHRYASTSRTSSYKHRNSCLMAKRRVFLKDEF